MPIIVVILGLFPITPWAAPIVPPGQLAASVHRDIPCDACHAGASTEGKTMPAVDCATCHADIAQKYQQSIHGRLRSEGVDAAAYCSDCHGTHDILSQEDPRARIAKKQVPATCGQCHGAVWQEFQSSVHGKAVARGNPDAPACTDCHGEHSILPAIEKLSRVYPTNIAKTTCPQCHASERIVTKYNLPDGRVDTFRDTYHGMASRLGDIEVANCASCHGIHNILPAADPASKIAPGNLVQTCGTCHPNAGENFVRGSVHGYEVRDLRHRLFSFVKWAYALLIGGVVGGYLIHNGLDYWKKLRASYRRRQREPYYPRMRRSERIQHGILLTSFLVLVITGFALRFGWYLPYVPTAINVLLRSTLHRIGGAAMVLTFCYHLGYCALTKRGRQLMRAMWFGRDDLKHAAQYVRYLVGWSAEKPAFGLLTYWEKMEYWSVLWGCVVMGATGVLLWFENWALQFLPKWGLDLVVLIHYLEAILATAAIVVGHLYFVIANPDVQPMSFTWVNGRITEEQARAEHPAAYRDSPPRTEEDD